MAAGQSCSSRYLSPDGARDVGGDDVGGVPAGAAAGPLLAWWSEDRRVKQLVISMLCVLPAVGAAVAHAELVALGVGHDHQPAAVLGSGVAVKTAHADPFEAFNLGVDVGCLDVEVHAVLGELGFADSLQQELGERP
jgi:hypothetical protein